MLISILVEQHIYLELVIGFVAFNVESPFAHFLTFARPFALALLFATSSPADTNCNNNTFLSRAYPRIGYHQYKLNLNYGKLSRARWFSVGGNDGAGIQILVGGAKEKSLCNFQTSFATWFLCVYEKRNGTMEDPDMPMVLSSIRLLRL
jgi:hypothetical protein